MTLRIAVVGVGGMGACHGRHIAELSGAEVAWVADPDRSAGETLATQLGAEWTADGFEAIADADAVVIASPDRFHFADREAALEHGIPMLCEKPLTVEIRDAAALVRHEVEAGRRSIQVGFMREYDEPHVQVHAALLDLGSVNHLRLVHRNTNPVARPLAQMLVESVIHDIHSTRWLAGHVEIMSVTTHQVTRERGLRFVLLTCELSNGGVATLEFDDAAAGYEVFVEASAEDGNVTAAPPLRALVRRDGAISSPIGDDWFAPFLGTYRVEMRAWLDSIASGAPFGPSAWDGYAAQAVVEAAVRSAARGRAETVELPDRPEIYS